MGNKTLLLESVPLLYRSAVSAAKLVPNPDLSEIAAGRHSVYDTWLYRSNASLDGTVPFMSVPGDGSDHAMFLQNLGISVADITYTNDPSGNYPLYHTLYETVFLPTKLMDPTGLKFSVATGQFWAFLTKMLADNVLIPFNVTDYARMIKQYSEDIRQEIAALQVISLNEQVNKLLEAIDRFQLVTKKFHAYMAYVRAEKLGCPYTDEINSRLMLIERCFINHITPVIQRGRNHIIYGVNPQNQYEGKPFPILTQLINQYKSEKQSEVLHNLQLQITTIQFSVESAILTLKRIP